MNTLTIILLTISLVLLISLVVLVFCFIKEKKTKKQQIKKIKIEPISDEAKKELISKTKKELNDELEILKDEAGIRATKILINAMESIMQPLIQEHTTTSINIVDDTVKGRIIGKEGRNKRAFEIITGVDLIIEKDNNFITLSSHNPIRREIARKLLEELIKTKSIDPTKIESMYKDVKKIFEEEIYQVGKNIVEDIFGISDLNKDVYNYIGKLKYRSSYGQNALTHICEVAQIAKSIALDLGLDTKKAVKVALLHDIGKSIDYEANTNHVDAGVDIAKELELDDDIIDGIISHHGETVCKNVYSEITKIADAISAARPGARINSYNEYFTRVQELEKIINNFDEVNNAYVIRSGRQVRVLVNPILVDDFTLPILANKIKNEIENNEITKGFNIKVTLIKENRYEFETSNKYIKD